MLGVLSFGDFVPRLRFPNVLLSARVVPPEDALEADDEDDFDQDATELKDLVRSRWVVLGVSHVGDEARGR